MSTVRPSSPAAAPASSIKTAPAEARQDFPGYQTVRFRDTPLGRFLTRRFLGCASLRLAVTLLSLFTFCLATATFLESAYSAHVAQDLVYQTWWFTLLLCLLAVNILCAALKKLPWKRHQIGFIITHTGLLVLVFGGLLTNLGGVEGQMMMVDSANPEIQQAVRMTNRSDTIQLVNQQQIEIWRMPKKRAPGEKGLDEAIRAVAGSGIEMSDALRDRFEGNHWALPLSPGSFGWKSDQHIRPKLPAWISFLKRLTDPFPGWARALDSDTRLVVENYYPHTERWPFTPSERPGEEPTFPALQLKLTTPMSALPIKRWVTTLPAFDGDAMPIIFDMFVLFDSTLLPEFLTPPAHATLGTGGQLVLAVGPKRKICRIPLDRVKDGQVVELEDTGLKLTLKKRGQLFDLLGQKSGLPDEHAPSYPALEFELRGPSGAGTYLTCARMPHMTSLREGADIGPVSAWYHHPDFRWGQKHKMGALQFLRAPGNRLFFRVYGKDGLREPGKELDASDTATIHDLPWKPMEMRFQVQSWMPDATRKENIIPRDVRPGADTAERLEPALRCVLETGGHKKEFWVRLSQPAAEVPVGNDVFLVRYRVDTRRVGFDLTLKNARQVSDPGTSRPASFESDVVLTPKDDPSEKQEYRVSMNNTLDHSGFKVYQSNYKPMTDPQSGEFMLDAEGKLVSMSGFTVADDPGLFCKYLGSALLVLGIATMFWMRAYFFKPRRAAV